VDGEFRGRAESEALVVRGVSPGQRRVTLRLGARERTLLSTVSSGHTTALSYRFPAEPASTDGLRGTLEKKGREAGEKVREGVDKAEREVLGALRDLLDKADAKREGRGQKPEQRDTK